MSKCTKITDRWLTEPTDVSPEELDAFFEHIEVCPFHAELFYAEEEKLRSLYRLARGLDSHGRVLLSSELHSTIAEHDRHLAMWKQSAQGTLPFKRIFLSNRGEDIAGSGKFFDFRNYEGHHVLDPHAGLQIWGVISADELQKVLLGFYPLLGVRHTGEEQLLPLDNGYTIGLRVEQTSESNFKIGFRCVEDEVLENEKSAQPVAKAKAAAAKNSGTSFFASVVAGFRWFVTGGLNSRSPIFGQAVTAGFVCCLIAAITLGAVLYQKTGMHPEPVVAEETCAWGENVTARVSEPQGDRTQTDNSRPQGTDEKISKRVRRYTLARRTGAPEMNNTGEETTVSDGDRRRQQKLIDVYSQSKTDVPTGVAIWSFRSVGFSGDVNADKVAVHTGLDAVLGQKLTAEMLKQSIEIVPLDGKALSSDPHVTISWSIIREENSVTVAAKLTAGADSKILTFRSDATCVEQACDKAVRDAVSGVFAVMGDMAVEQGNETEIAF